MSSKAVAKAMNAYIFVDPGLPKGVFKHLLHAPTAVLLSILTLKQILLGPVFHKIGPKLLQYAFRQVGVAVFFAFSANGAANPNSRR